ncbi:hypothetical protein LX32DRAFT_690405 [Colletotrichum zoysiae]|uniref:Uncharacterized protein n=1 Tax=Colletotrichum zoysiae TaxID=1216348 RepID=A0AAD9HQ31_9PEZI|nr:hypothetical protein LX32DRAFT_690405 [Colletotrichum zoysiae]
MPVALSTERQSSPLWDTAAAASRKPKRTIPTDLGLATRTTPEWTCWALLRGKPESVTDHRPEDYQLGEEAARVVSFEQDFAVSELELNTRCVNIYRFQDTAGKSSRAAGPGRVSRAYYVGADSITGRPVVADGIAKASRGRNPPKTDADFTGASFVQRKL